MKWTLAFAFALITAPLAAEEAQSPAVDLLHAPLAIAGLNAPAPGAPAEAARTYRAMWADAAIRDFMGLSENAWDFTKPEGIPGFGPLPQPESR